MPRLNGGSSVCVFIKDSDPAALIGDGLAAVVARCEKEASAARAAGRPRRHDLERGGS
jgi:hypothetical protein